MTIKARLTLAVVALLALATVVLGSIAVTSARDSMVKQIDERLRDRSTRPPPFGPGGPPGAAGPPGAQPGAAGRPPADGQARRRPPLARGGDEDDFRDTAELLFDGGGERIAASPSGFADDPDPYPRLPQLTSADGRALLREPRTLPAERGSLEYRVFAAETPLGELRVLATPLRDVDAAGDRLLRTLLAAGALLVLLAAALSWWLIRRGLQPVDRMIDTAGAIAAGDLSQRVEHADERSELGRLGAALDEMLTQLEASQTRLRRFVADASHELRTPVASIRGYAELYRKGGLAEPEALERALRRIESESSRMGSLVDDLLLLARLDQQQPLAREQVDLAELAADAAADFRAVDPERPLELALDGAASVVGDERRLRQVLANLLANARVHTPAGTPVRLSLASRDGRVELVVADSGPGLGEADRERIFERFYRADESRSRDTGGSGLGLSIVAAVIEAHGGEVGVDSRTGEGTTFTVRLPDHRPRGGPLEG